MFRRRLMRFRQTRTPAQAALAFGISLRYYQAIERGERAPSGAILRRLGLMRGTIYEDDVGVFDEDGVMGLLREDLARCASTAAYAAALGLHPSYISNTLAGRCGPPPALLARLGLTKRTVYLPLKAGVHAPPNSSESPVLYTAAEVRSMLRKEPVKALAAKLDLSPGKLRRVMTRGAIPTAALEYLGLTPVEGCEDAEGSWVSLDEALARLTARVAAGRTVWPVTVRRMPGRVREQLAGSIRLDDGLLRFVGLRLAERYRMIE